MEKQPVYDEVVTLVADGAYSGERNVKTAAKHRIKFVATNFTGRKPKDIFAEFKFSENGAREFTITDVDGYVLTFAENKEV